MSGEIGLTEVQTDNSSSSINNSGSNVYVVKCLWQCYLVITYLVVIYVCCYWVR